jgi:hypothetical protein
MQHFAIQRQCVGLHIASINSDLPSDVITCENSKFTQILKYHISENAHPSTGNEFEYRVLHTGNGGNLY